MGAQGTGKGTVAGLLCNELGIMQLSTGDIFRKNIKEQTELGIEANKYISQGQLVPDEITVPMVASALDSDEARNGVILDGFPRTTEQARKLDEMLKERNKKIDMVINLTTPREEIIDRIITRRVCPNCKATYNIKINKPQKEGICDKCGTELTQREDDKSEEAINKRLEIYDTQTAPVLSYYEEKGIVLNEEITASKNRMADIATKEIIEKLK
jgi:adenylate kinase